VRKGGERRIEEEEKNKDLEEIKKRRLKDMKIIRKG
jgi:hypothetical protein